MITILVISLGAFIGAPLRALIEQYASRKRSALTTLLIVNSLGSLLAGFSLGAFSGNMRLFFITGLAGTFTTFSGWALALDMYSRERSEDGPTRSTHLIRLGFIVVLAVGIPILCAWVGWTVSQFLV